MEWWLKLPDVGFEENIWSHPGQAGGYRRTNSWTTMDDAFRLWHSAILDKKRFFEKKIQTAGKKKISFRSRRLHLKEAAEKAIAAPLNRTALREKPLKRHFFLSTGKERRSVTSKTLSNQMSPRQPVRRASIVSIPSINPIKKDLNRPVILTVQEGMIVAKPYKRITFSPKRQKEKVLSSKLVPVIDDCSRMHPPRFLPAD